MDLISQLPFDLIAPNPYIFKRYARGQEIDSEWIKPDPILVNIDALITPYLKKDIVDNLPEALRKRKVIRIFSNAALKEQIDTGEFEADEVVYSNESYRVFKLGDWINVNGFTGYEAYAVRIDSKELSLLSEA